MGLSKELAIPLIEGVKTADDMPYTISNAVLYRARINSFQELPKDKRPPRNLWDKTHKLDEFFEDVFDIKSNGRETEFIEFDENEVE